LCHEVSNIAQRIQLGFEPSNIFSLLVYFGLSIKTKNVRYVGYREGERAYHGFIDALLDFRQASAHLRSLTDLGCHIILLPLHVRPRKLFLQFIRFLLLFSSFGGLFEAEGGITKRGAQVRQHFPLLREGLEGRSNVVKTRVIFVGKLGELGSAQEELGMG
jgi:hypothetical protein